MLVFSCTSTKNITIDQDAHKLIETDSTDYIVKKGDSIFIDTILVHQNPCFKFAIKSGRYIKSHIRFLPGDRCLRELAFNGNREAINLISDYLELIEAPLFESDNIGYRGPKLFERLLELADYNNDCKKSLGRQSYGIYPLRSLWESIKSIDGQEIQPWLDKRYRDKDLHTIWENKNICLEVRDVQLNLVPIRKAWREGLIILKDFGEE